MVVIKLDDYDLKSIYGHTATSSEEEDLGDQVLHVSVTPGQVPSRHRNNPCSAEAQVMLKVAEEMPRTHGVVRLYQPAKAYWCLSGFSFGLSLKYCQLAIMRNRLGGSYFFSAFGNRNKESYIL
ncbi:uncharacterized protein ACIB01_013491 isoform 1-T1 [Guaruba guarouba]